MLWKIYFSIIVVLTISSYLYNYTIGFNRFWDFFDIVVSVFSLVGLFGYSWERGIISQTFWQKFFWVSIGWDIIYKYFIPIPPQAIEYFPPNLSQTILSTIEFIPIIPLFIALFIYGYRKTELWEQ